MDVQREIDTRGLNCPLPILKAKKALADWLRRQGHEPRFREFVRTPAPDAARDAERTST